MTLDEIAKKLWNDVFGDAVWAQDCFGTWMHKDAHSNEKVIKRRPGNSETYDYSWNVDHIRPKSNFQNESDADFFNNYEPMHRENNLEKSDNFPYFAIKGKRYQVISEDNGKCYGIIDSNTGRRVDWKGTQNRKYR